MCRTSQGIAALSFFAAPIAKFHGITPSQANKASAKLKLLSKLCVPKNEMDFEVYPDGDMSSPDYESGIGVAVSAFSD